MHPSSLFSRAPPAFLLAAMAFALGLGLGAAAGPGLASKPATAVASPAPPDATAAAAPRLPSDSHPAEVLRVIDGDTFEARVRVWPGIDITTKVRLRNIDTPELRARCPDERVK